MSYVSLHASTVCIFSLFTLVFLEVCQFYRSLKNNCFIDFSLCFPLLNFVDYFSYIYYFFPSACFQFALILGSRSGRLNYWCETFLSFLMHTFHAIKFSLSTALIVSHKYWYIFIFIQFSFFFLSSLETFSFIYVLLCCLDSKCVYFPVMFPLLISNLMWLENALYDLRSLKFVEISLDTSDIKCVRFSFPHRNQFPNFPDNY